MTKPTMLLALALAGCADNHDDPSYPPATAHDDNVTLAEDEALPLMRLADNDVDVDFVKVVDMPLHGSIVNGKYEPQPGYFGPDQFTYAGSSSEYSPQSSQATVHVMIASDDIPYEQSHLLADTDADDLATGDIDGDGKIDLITADRRRNEMVVFRNETTAEGAFAVERLGFEGGTAPSRVALADLDGDGRIDVITAAYDGLTVFRNLTAPQGPVAFAGPVRLGTGIMSGVAAADFDGDGKPDLAAIESVSSYNDGRMHVWLNVSTAGVLAFGTAATFATPPQPTRIEAIDADADARADLAVLANDKLALFVNATAGGATLAAFGARLDRGTAPDPIAMFLVDLDGDTRREIGVLHVRGALWIYANGSSGTQTPNFEAARTLEVPYSTGIVGPAELDGDGVVDLIAVTSDSAPFAFLYNRSQPQVYDFEPVLAEIADVATRKTAAFALPTAVSFVDLDGVPPLEIVVASRTGSNTSDDGGVRLLFGR